MSTRFNYKGTETSLYPSQALQYLENDNDEKDKANILNIFVDSTGNELPVFIDAGI